MKKFVNDPQQFVPEMLKGIELSNPDTLRYVPEYNLIMRADAPRDDKVSIIQGSGSGHEPAHVMAVGPGMLDAACPGDVSRRRPRILLLRQRSHAKASSIITLNGDKIAFDMARVAEAEPHDRRRFGDDVLKDSTSTSGAGRGRTFRSSRRGAASERARSWTSSWLWASGNSVTRLFMA